MNISKIICKVPINYVTASENSHLIPKVIKYQHVYIIFNINIYLLK